MYEFGIKKYKYYSLEIFQASLEGNYCMAVRILLVHFPFNIHKTFWFLNPVHGNIYIYWPKSGKLFNTVPKWGLKKQKTLTGFLRNVLASCILKVHTYIIKRIQRVSNL
jgi:hypothetical protein